MDGPYSWDSILRLTKPFVSEGFRPPSRWWPKEVLAMAQFHSCQGNS